MKKLLPIIAYFILGIMPTNVLAKMGYISNGSGSDIFGFLLLCGFLIWVLLGKLAEGHYQKNQKKISTNTPKKKPTYNGFEVKTIPSGKHEGKKYTVNSDGAFNSLLPANAVISQKTKKELELDRMTKIIAEQKKERERKKRLKDNQKKKVVTSAFDKLLRKEELRLLKEKRLNEVRRKAKEKIENEEDEILITPEIPDFAKTQKLIEELELKHGKSIQKLIEELELKETNKEREG